MSYIKGEFIRSKASSGHTTKPKRFKKNDKRLERIETGLEKEATKAMSTPIKIAPNSKDSEMMVLACMLTSSDGLQHAAEGTTQI
jgi:hypothetical protein